MKTNKPIGMDILILIIALFTITVVTLIFPAMMETKLVPVDSDNVLEREKDLPQKEATVAVEYDYAQPVYEYNYVHPTSAYTYAKYAKKEETRESWYFVFGLLIGGVTGMMICSIFIASRQEQQKRKLIRADE